VVPSSDSRWTAAPHRPQVPDQTSRSDRTEAVRPSAHPKDDIAGWTDELLIDFPDFPDCTLDSAANKSSFLLDMRPLNQFAGTGLRKTFVPESFVYSQYRP
jgi:hypothetical protein